MPIYLSIMDVMKVFENFQRMYGKYPRKESLTLNAPYIGEGVRSSGSLDQSVRCLVKNRYDALSFTERLLSVVSVNPFVTAVEVIPLSFVADWIINVSDFVAASTGPNVHSDQGACWSVKTNGIWYFDSGKLGSTSVLVDTYYRIPINLNDHIGLALDVGYGWKRQVDSLALSFNMFSHRARSLK